MVVYWRKVFLAAALFSILDVKSEKFGNNEHSNQLLDYLTESEKVFLFGADHNEAQFEIAHLKQPKRRKRSLLHEDQELLSLKNHLNLKLNPRNSFLDPQFLLMRRWSNDTEAVLDQHSDEELDSCYFRSENAALYACDDVRGLVKSDDSYYFIHPLPERFHIDDAKTHVIVKRQINDLKQDNEESCVERDIQTIVTPETVKIWTKHRRKRDVETGPKNKDSLEGFKLNLAHRNKTIGTFVKKLVKETQRQKRAILPAVFVETAVFVDRDLYKHMTINFPKDTERELVRFILAMINAVQLLYHDHSLGRPVNFILKRLEILHEDPVNLKRPHDIDRFLSNFCTWQRLENPPGDNDPLHWDHALILTGLDLYVVNKNGKVSSQVVGLAPVAGMCTVTSSCTVNEGRHFESVYVVAHEIGHNLGMRHDGPLADNGCDPSAYIMSPTLGSGKITWSQCSSNYLQKFLDTVQSRCLLDHGNSAGQLDHSAEGILPGERFDADQQCMLKYGRGSRHSTAQNLEDICRDLHCQRERYTWTSHPALEGTRCGVDMYCRGGECVDREGSTVPRGSWGRWSEWSECASACLLGAGRAPAASGVAVASRKCNRPRHESSSKYCTGHDKKYQTCNAHQCNNVPRMTVREFADQICYRARDVDPDLIGTGLQRIDSDDVSSACAVWCDTRGGGYKSRGWALPDGTLCAAHARMYCIAGVCQKFTCSSSADTEFSLKPGECEWEALQLQTAASQATSTKTSGTWRRAVGSEWRPTSGCHYHCIAGGAGVRLVTSHTTHAHNIQLCNVHTASTTLGCTQRKSPYEYATMVCTKYKDRVRRLSGLGMQISPVLEDPDRACRVACQDERVAHRFYLVNGQEGWFPLGTACGKMNTSYCVSGKCLEFGPDNTPLSEMVLRLPLLGRSRSRTKRSLLRPRLAVKATLDQGHLEDLIARLNLTLNANEHVTYHDAIPDNIELDFTNPVHVAPEDTLLRKKPRPTWD
ncbi:A disintegrin and metalloproteinase with thrombospondin motifs adt-1-like [Plodia interpunctella]|uniref:A disintegrin and metalloproteinase with thrombospondin motifs adt-1-like n=1 Tax=Plodia interpunctella TaxID=58824 RepID=UPI0023679A46|nr:A disintegrin and metalloproteinase with thrombospondin motifs adt-1-like [Plodia interpunctella]